MRIVSGKYKGRLIKPPKKIKARPTTDFAKENLFNILETRIDFEDKEVLDLFAGTGNMSYEFVSRGCKSVIAIELNYPQVKFIKETANKMEMPQLKVKKAEVFSFLASCSQQYDIIFADPPYQMANIEKLPEVISQNKLLKPEGMFILEHSKQADLYTIHGFYENRNYGSVNFSFFSL
ncbi:MAG: 16S rRNA (guanine(966)-N(2))-methyltransferase RsmD [Bacteroidales bacterium]